MTTNIDSIDVFFDEDNDDSSSTELQLSRTFGSCTSNSSSILTHAIDILQRIPQTKANRNLFISTLQQYVSTLNGSEIWIELERRKTSEFIRLVQGTRALWHSEISKCLSSSPPAGKRRRTSKAASTRQYTPSTQNIDHTIIAVVKDLLSALFSKGSWGCLRDLVSNTSFMQCILDLLWTNGLRFGLEKEKESQRWKYIVNLSLEALSTFWKQYCSMVNTPESRRIQHHIIESLLQDDVLLRFITSGPNQFLGYLDIIGSKVPHTPSTTEKLYEAIANLQKQLLLISETNIHLFNKWLQVLLALDTSSGILSGSSLAFSKSFVERLVEDLKRHIFELQRTQTVSLIIKASHVACRCVSKLSGQWFKSRSCLVNHPLRLMENMLITAVDDVDLRSLQSALANTLVALLGETLLASSGDCRGHELETEEIFMFAEQVFWITEFQTSMYLEMQDDERQIVERLRQPLDLNLPDVDFIIETLNRIRIIERCAVFVHSKETIPYIDNLARIKHICLATSSAVEKFAIEVNSNYSRLELAIDYDSVGLERSAIGVLMLNMIGRQDLLDNWFTAHSDSFISLSGNAYRNYRDAMYDATYPYVRKEDSDEIDPLPIFELIVRPLKMLSVIRGRKSLIAFKSYWIQTQKSFKPLESANHDCAILDLINILCYLDGILDDENLFSNSAIVLLVDSPLFWKLCPRLSESQDRIFRLFQHILPTRTANIWNSYSIYSLVIFLERAPIEANKKLPISKTVLDLLDLPCAGQKLNIDLLRLDILAELNVVKQRLWRKGSFGAALNDLLLNITTLPSLCDNTRLLKQINSRWRSLKDVKTLSNICRIIDLLEVLGASVNFPLMSYEGDLALMSTNLPKGVKEGFVGITKLLQNESISMFSESERANCIALIMFCIQRRYNCCLQQTHRLFCGAGQALARCWRLVVDYELENAQNNKYNEYKLARVISFHCLYLHFILKILPDALVYLNLDYTRFLELVDTVFLTIEDMMFLHPQWKLLSFGCCEIRELSLVSNTLGTHRSLLMPFIMDWRNPWSLTSKLHTRVGENIRHEFEAFKRFYPRDSTSSACPFKGFFSNLISPQCNTIHNDRWAQWLLSVEMPALTKLWQVKEDYIDALKEDLSLFRWMTEMGLNGCSYTMGSPGTNAIHPNIAMLLEKRIEKDLHSSTRLMKLQPRLNQDLSRRDQLQCLLGLLLQHATDHKECLTLAHAALCQVFLHISAVAPTWAIAPLADLIMTGTETFDSLTDWTLNENAFRDIPLATHCLEILAEVQKILEGQHASNTSNQESQWLALTIAVRLNRHAYPTDFPTIEFIQQEPAEEDSKDDQWAMCFKELQAETKEYSPSLTLSNTDPIFCELAKTIDKVRRETSDPAISDALTFRSRLSFKKSINHEQLAALKMLDTEICLAAIAVGKHRLEVYQGFDSQSRFIAQKLKQIDIQKLTCWRFLDLTEVNESLHLFQLASYLAASQDYSIRYRSTKPISGIELQRIPMAEAQASGLRVLSESIDFIHDLSERMISQYSTLEFTLCQDELSQINGENGQAGNRASRLSKHAQTRPFSDHTRLLRMTGTHKNQVTELIKLEMKMSLQWFSHLAQYAGEGEQNVEIESLVAEHSLYLASDFVQYGPQDDEIAVLLGSFFTQNDSSDSGRDVHAQLARSLLPWSYKLASSLAVHHTSHAYEKAIIQTLKRIGLMFPLQIIAEILPFIFEPADSSAPVLFNGKSKAFHCLVEDISQYSRCHRQIVTMMKKVWLLYVLLTNYPVDVSQKKFKLSSEMRLSIPGTEELQKAWKACFKLDHCAILTSLNEISRPIPSSNMDEIDLRQFVPTVAQWIEEVVVSDSGKSIPKILTVIDEGGYRHNQLLKRNDDVRQDRTVQRVYTFIDKVCKPDMGWIDLTTYAIIPLNSRCGVIGWLENFTTVKDLLFRRELKYANKCCHEYYHPQDVTVQEGCKLMTKARADGTLHETFTQLIEPRSHPCFLQLFLSLFEERRTFFRARNNYIRSLAFHSITGYIFGVGDRHIKNIMVSTVTGELAHVDFGYMFESSRLLAIPERIPIRFTKQMTHLISPIGEKTYQTFLDDMINIKHAMRTRENYVIAAVSIFINDALRGESQAGSADKENNRLANSMIIISDPAGDKRSNMNARKALFRVRHKLRGTEFSFYSVHFIAPSPPSEDELELLPLAPPTNGLSSKDQIKVVTQIARNPVLLSQMFIGWTPWV